MTNQTGEQETIVVWFSCGVASAVALMETVKRYGNTHIIRAVNNPVMEEDEDNRRFLADVERWLGIKIESACNPKYPTCSTESVWIDRKYMSGNAGAPCTVELKKEARYLWELTNKADYHVLGFTLDEIGRFKRFQHGERANSLPVLIDAQLTKQDCHNIIVNAGLKPPRVYDMGYPNANCIGCVKASSPTYWNHVRKTHPVVFEARSVLSRKIGCRLVRYQGKRIFLDELPPDAKGRSMKTLKAPECGIFCDTK